MDYSSFIAQTLKLSSEIATSNFGKVKGSVKENDSNQVLTETDLEIGKFIISKIKENFPTHNIIDEESGVIDNKSEYTWVVDPIDGTSNFANGVPNYGIMIGLLIKETPVAGGISLPFFNEIVIAEKVKGVFLNGRKIKVTDEKKLSNVLVAYGIDGHQENPGLTKDEMKTLEKLVLNIRNLRSSNSVYDAVQVAKGNYGAIINKTSKIWDNVAQQIIIEQAGGIYTDYFGKPVVYTNVMSRMNTNFTFLGAAPKIHKEILKLV